MTIWGAFTDSIQAMQAQSDALAVISQNVANVNTTGYKQTVDNFQTLLSEHTDNTNIFGVQVAKSHENDVQGNFQSTGIWDNLSINGPGFFVLNSALDGSGNTSFTRAGNFAETVVNTTDVSKPATATGSVSYLSDGHGDYLMGWKAKNGVAATSDDLTSLSAVGVSLGSTLNGKATSQIAIQGSIPSDAAGGTATSGVPVYDNSFSTQTLALNFTKTASDNWAVTYSVDPRVGTIPSGTQTNLAFDGAGNFLSQSGTSSIPINWADGTSSTISVDFSKMSQLASGVLVVNAQTQNGYASSTMVKAEFDPNGNLYGDFSNGKKLLLYTLPVATFTAPNSLQDVTGTLFKQTAAAGTLSIDPANHLNDTSFTPGALETSNVSLEDQFSRLITTQTAYNSATKVFDISDKMTQTARDLLS